MKKILVLLLLFSFFLVSCSKIRDSAGVNRKNIDEFGVVENPPLVIPPDFNLLPPEQLSEKDIDDVESDLAEEILFGINTENDNESDQLSTMENILKQTEANIINNDIRQEINEEFASEKKSNSNRWSDEVEILDSIAESERLRNELMDIDSETENGVSTVKIKKKKKKRRFFFF